MSIIVRMRKQTAIWWQRSATPDVYGQFSFRPPVEITCRWDDTALEFLSHDGERQVSRAVVYVDRVMQPGDRLKRGALESDTPDDPLTLSDAPEIKRFDQLPNLRATETLLTAYL